MLQTAEYTTGLLRSITEFQGTPDDVSEAVQARLNRSRVVREGDHRFALLLEEAVLYRVTRDDITERSPRHEVTSTSEPSVSNRFPLCRCPIHAANPGAPERERRSGDRG